MRRVVVSALLERYQAAVCVLTLVGLLGAACEPCNRDGCDALQRRASNQNTPRVAGIVAHESDFVGNDCQECGFAAVDIKAWRVEREVATEAELSAVAKTSPHQTSSSADGEYTLSLVPDSYVVCFQNSCFNASTSAEGTTTLNVRLVDGISRGFLGLPNTRALTQKDAIFLNPS